MTTQLYKFQLQDVRRLHQMNGRALIGNEMGTGKTIISLSYIHRHPNIRPVVVVCPASLKLTWERESHIHFGMRAEVLSGTKPPREGIKTKATLYIVNYDILPSWIDYLKSLNPQLVIGDEIHYISNRKTIRNRQFNLLVKGVPHVLLLSGTPLTNRPAELWPALNIVNPELYPSFWSYAHKFCSPRRTPWGWDFRGASNLELLHHRLIHNNVMIRRTKAEVLKELPSKQRSVLPMEISNPKEYEKAQKEFLTWLEEVYGPAKVRSALAAERLVRMGYLKRLAGQLKYKSVKEWIDGFLSSSDGKLLVFAIHKPIIKSLHKDYGGQSVVVDGDTSLKDRQLAVERFQGDKRTRIFIGNIKAAGVGLTLTAASTVLFAEMDWVPALHIQAEDRAHRIGTKSSVNIYYSVGKRTIEEHLAEVIQKKMQVVSAVLDGENNGDSLDIYTILCKAMTKEQP